MNNSSSTVIWSTAAPFWPALPPNGSGRTMFTRPAILRFAKDSFMDDFIKLLAGDPTQLQSYQAVYETWREPIPDIELAPVESPAAQRTYTPAFTGRIPFNPLRRSSLRPRANIVPISQKKYLKLYQPAHERFYMVCACLVCQEAGMPDRALDSNNFEKVSFVLRRLIRKASNIVPPNTIPNSADPNLDLAWDEYAWVTQTKTGSWQKVTNPKASLAENEERLPLFPLSYKDENGRRRRLLAGLIPVSKRDSYVNAPRIDNPDKGLKAGEELLEIEKQPDRREVLFVSDVAGPWRNIIGMIVRKERALAGSQHDNGPTQSQLNAMSAQIGIDISNQQQLTSWYVLLDFADFLHNYIPKVWDWIESGTIPSQNDNSSEASLYSMLSAHKNQANSMSLVNALKRIVEDRHCLDTVASEYKGSGDAAYPEFAFNLADPSLADLVTETSIGPGEPPQISALEKAVADALSENTIPVSLPELPVAAFVSPQTGDDYEWFMIRCVFESPICGLVRPPYQPQVVSDPTQIFQMASFFDSDAPARPIRISLPIDATPGGLRKFAKNTAIQLSDSLACQKERLGKLTFVDLIMSVLPWPLHKDLDVSSTACPGSSGLGLICSLSIPIITICALILLLIIVNLLDVIFHWVPFFIFCFPFPKFKGKKVELPL